jgi:cysteine desulfurase
MSSVIVAELQAAFSEIRVNRHPNQRLAHNLSLTIPGVEAKALIHLLKDKLSFSTGSACSTTKVEPSHVLKAIGLSDDETFQTIRLGLGRATENAGEIAVLLKQGIRQILSR